ncbi:polyphosphate kinase 1 [Anaerolineales bacterium]
MDDSRHTPLPELNTYNYINRELSTLDFQRRVLHMARDPRLPLLERVKFVAIVGNNLDEFFMVRVASYIQKIEFNVAGIRPDGLTPQQLLRRIHEEARQLINEQRNVMRELFVLLEAENIIIQKLPDLDQELQAAVRQYFYEDVFPVLTPLAADHARPFPFISNMSLNLAVYMRRLDNLDEDVPFDFARIKIPAPDIVPRLVPLNEIAWRYLNREVEGTQFLWIEDIIQSYIDSMFPGMEVVEAYPFRVLRNSDIDYEHEQDDELADIKSIIEQSLRRRQFGNVVRLSVPVEISEHILQRLVSGLDVQLDRDVYMIDGALASSDLFELVSRTDRPDLKFPLFVPRMPEVMPNPERDIFSVIRKGNVLLHHPFDSFLPVESFFRAAATDPDVLAIKATLYRVGKNSPVVKALLQARDNDKQVTVLVELKARFDEENNLEWAQALERKGVHVVYGVEELPVKTHAKITLVVRRESTGVRRYVHMGTGNYNAATARLYTDLGLLSADEGLADDATRLFNRLTGYAPNTDYQRLLVAPEYLFDRFIDLIDNETQAALDGKPARIILKMNQMEEDTVIQKLYQASQAGVQVDCIVRGFCCLRPGVPGLSENIRVVSIVGRFLEHSRIFYFQNSPEDQQLYIGSADIMRRNLHNRVEVVFPILDPGNRQKIQRILLTSLSDNQLAWEMDQNGEYHQVPYQEGDEIINSQDIFMNDSFGLR